MHTRLDSDAPQSGPKEYMTKDGHPLEIDLDGESDIMPDQNPVDGPFEEPGELQGDDPRDPDKEYLADDELEALKEMVTMGFEEKISGWWVMGHDKHGKPKPTRPAYQPLADYFNHVYLFLTMAETGMIYSFKSLDHFDLIERRVIKHWVEIPEDPGVNPQYSRNQMSEFLERLDRMNIVSIKDFMKASKGYINLKNGVLDLKTGGILPHSPKYCMTYILPYEYDKAATCPRFEKFLDEITDGRHDLAKILVEFMGYAISNSECYAAKALILTGEGSNGKSIFMDLVKALVGPDNYASMSLTALNNDQKRAAIEHKFVNIGEETNVKALGESEVFKTMVTGGDIDIKRVYKEPYTIKNYTKLIISCNELPKSSDRSLGLYRRMLLVPFDVEFSDEKGNRDKFILTKLKDELPGILNLAIEGYQRLEKNKFEFTRSKVIDEVMEEYKADNDNIVSWLQENCKLDKTRDTFSSTLYQNYKNFCEESGDYAVKRQSFLKRLKQEVPGYQKVRKQNGHTRDYAIVGLRLDSGN